MRHVGSVAVNLIKWTVCKAVLMMVIIASPGHPDRPEEDWLTSVPSRLEFCAEHHDVLTLVV